MRRGGGKDRRGGECRGKREPGKPRSSSPESQAPPAPAAAVMVIQTSQGKKKCLRLGTWKYFWKEHAKQEHVFHNSEVNSGDSLTDIILVVYIYVCFFENKPHELSWNVIVFTYDIV